MGGEEAKGSKRESGGDITLRGQEEGYRRKCKQDWDNLSYRILHLVLLPRSINTSGAVIWYTGIGSNIFCFSTKCVLDTTETYGKVKKLLFPGSFRNLVEK